MFDSPQKRRLRRQAAARKLLDGLREQELRGLSSKSSPPATPRSPVPPGVETPVQFLDPVMLWLDASWRQGREDQVPMMGSYVVLVETLTAEGRLVCEAFHSEGTTHEAASNLVKVAAGMYGHTVV